MVSYDSFFYEQMIKLNVRKLVKLAVSTTLEIHIDNVYIDLVKAQRNSYELEGSKMTLSP